MQNPFEYSGPLNLFLDDEEDLSVFVQEMRKARSLSWSFNPWWHRLANWTISKLIPKFHVNNKYDWNNYDPDNYVGPEKRSVPRTAYNHVRSFIKFHRMPKTLKIRLDEVG